MKTYSAWVDDDGYTFIEGAGPPKAPPSGEYRLLWICQAETWEEACTLYHAFMGWDPYKPM